MKIDKFHPPPPGVWGGGESTGNNKSNKALSNNL